MHGSAAPWVFDPELRTPVINETFQHLCSRHDLTWTEVLQRRAEWTFTGRKQLGLNHEQECWSILTITNTGADDARVLLEHGLPLTSRLDLYHSADSRLLKTQALGLDIPFAHWTVDYRMPVFDLLLKPGLNTVLVRQVSRDVFLFDWRLYSPEDFYSRIIPELLLFGGFFAICFALSFYNLVIFFVNREISHVFYFLYLNCYAMAQLYLTGFLKQLVFHEMGAGLNQLGIIAINCALLFTISFIYYFLDFQKYKPWFAKITQGYGMILVIPMLLAVAGQIPWAAFLTQPLSIAGSLMAILAAVIALKRRHPLAVYFLIAWSMLIVGNVIQVLHLTALVPDHPWIFSLNFIGASFEAIIISYALAHKMRLGRLQETQRRRHAFLQLEKMVYPHQMDQMKEGAILETTMPHASGEAVVICLDIIASTSSQIDNLPNFLRRFFDRCGHLMNCDYHGDSLSASGFRIKEMGDGFLCAVGFPFQTPPGRVSHEVAMQLAFGFLSAFDEESMDTSSAPRTYCSIGIARGRIEGFFTVSGIRSYELFGDGIVLATRYESLRKQWHAEREGHMITMSSRMYESLPPAYQPLFREYRLTRGSGSIRNDATADAFYRGIFDPGAARRILDSTDDSKIPEQAS